MIPVDNTIIAVDSDDPKYFFFMASELNCKFKVLKTKIGDICYVMKVVNDECHIQLDVKGCEATKK